MAKILLADSVHARPEIAHSFLARHGCEILTVDELAGLIEVVREARPDLLVLEASTRSLDVLAVCRAIKSDETLAALKVVFLVASTLDEKACRSAGADDVAQTPLTPMRLLEIARRHLGIRERRADRAAAVLRVDFTRNGEPGSGFTRDISGNGLFLTTRKRLQPGDRIELSFRLKGASGEPNIESAGIVARVEAYGEPSEVIGAGIELTGLGPREHIELGKYVRDHAGAMS